MIDLQKSLGDRLLEAYNEEHFIQEELKDIRTMNKQQYLEEKTIMSDERKVKIKASCVPHSPTQFSNPTYGIDLDVFRLKQKKRKQNRKRNRLVLLSPMKTKMKKKLFMNQKKNQNIYPKQSQNQF